ncbi:MAG: O-antigen ligase family protein [Ghiorsea sp.]
MKSSKTKKTSLFNSHWLILIAPLFAYPFMVNLRVFPFVAPNEEPKWAVLIVCALWMGLTTAWLWFKRNSPLQVQRPSLVSTLLALYTLLLGIGVFIGPNTTEGMIRYAFWIFCIAILLLSIWATRNEQKWQSALTWSLAIGSFIFSLRYWWSYVLDYGKPNYNIHVLFSPIGHVNFTGDVLIMLLPILLWALLTVKNPIIKVINWFSATTVLTILLVASSRGALGGLAIACIVLGLLIIKHYPSIKKISNKKKYYLPSALFFSVILTSFLTYQALPFHYRDLARISSTAGQAASGQSKIELTPGAEQPPLVDIWVKLSPLLGARTSIFASATAMTLEAPLLGQGTGNFAWVYPNFSNRYTDFRDPLSSARTFTTNPHNVVLQIASQNGIPAMLIFMGLLLFFWYRLVKSTWIKWDPWLAAGAGALSAVIFDALFNHTFFNPASMFVFALLAGSWWGKLFLQEKKPFTIPTRSSALVMVIVVLLLAIWPTRWLLSEWSVGQAMAYAKHPQLESQHYQTAYGWDQENFRAVFGMGQVAYKQKKYAKSAQYFEKFERFYPYNPPALNMLGAAYMTTGQFLKAEAALQRALKIYPGFKMVEQNLRRVQNILRQRPSKQ